jgi:hypothetical protein
MQGFFDGDSMSVRVTDVYAINDPDIVAEDFNGQVVILNLSDGHYFSLGGVASPIWAALLDGHTPQAILGSIAASQPGLRDSAAQFLDRVLELGLIRPREGSATPTGPLAADWLGEAAQIEVFDDLAELIFADPIHDVDEQAGWPAPRPDR